jgi:hypothetical protein
MKSRYLKARFPQNGQSHWSCGPQNLISLAAQQLRKMLRFWTLFCELDSHEFRTNFVEAFSIFYPTDCKAASGAHVGNATLA